MSDAAASRAPGDLFDLERFVNAQEHVYHQALSELRRGIKVSHWMWFIFPQLRDLGTSETSHRYGISSLSEAQHFLGHQVLGPRLLECTRAVNSIVGRDAVQIFGPVDAQKFHSSMTLFHRASETTAEFSKALEMYFDGSEDQQTLQRL